MTWLSAVLLTGLLSLACSATASGPQAAISSAQARMGTAPKEVLEEAETALRNPALDGRQRALWLAVASEAAYALALPEQAIRHAKQGLALADLEAEDRQRLAIAHAGALDLAGRSEEAIAELMTVIGTLEHGAFDPQYLIDALAARASAYYSTGNHRAALADLLRAYPRAPEHGERTLRADVASSLGNVYTALDDYENAERFYLEAIEYAVAQQTWVRASVAEYSLAAVYRRTEDWERAADYFERSRQHSAMADDLQGVAYAEFGLGRVALQQGDIARAEQLFLHSLPTFISAGDLLPQAFIAHGRARIAMLRKQPVEALTLIEQATQLVSQVNDLDLRQQLLSLRADAEFSLQRYDAAFASLKAASQAKEDMLKSRIEESLSEMRVRFDTERQERQNALLMKENQLAAANLAQQTQTARLYAVSVVALTAILGLLSFLAYRSRQVRARLAAQALTDELTGVANRRHTMSVLAAEFDRARRYQTPLTVAMLDLDLFKQINDRYGHAAGDQVLQAFCTMMGSRLRRTDCFGRIGGEEFLAVLPHTGIEEASAVMERLRLATMELGCPALRGERQPSVSIGLAAFSTADEKLETLVKRADEAVYRAKEGGRNRIEVG